MEQMGAYKQTTSSERCSITVSLVGQVSTTLANLLYHSSVLFHNVRVVLNSETCRGTYLGGDSEKARAMCLSSAQDIISIVRKYRTSYRLKHTPFIFIYGIV